MLGPVLLLEGWARIAADATQHKVTHSLPSLRTGTLYRLSAATGHRFHQSADANAAHMPEAVLPGGAQSRLCELAPLASALACLSLRPQLICTYCLSELSQRHKDSRITVSVEAPSRGKKMLPLPAPGHHTFIRPGCAAAPHAISIM